MKQFLSTTAVLVALSGAAYADAHSSGFGAVKTEKGDFYGSDLIGMRIYNSENEYEMDARVADGAELEWDDIGEINDLIISADGELKAVILGVGGFLGIGERDVAVTMDAIKVLREEGDSDDRFLVVKTSKEELEQAPAFERDMSEEMEQDMANAAEETEEAVENAAAETEEMAKDAETKTAEYADDTGLKRELLPRPAVSRDGYQDVEWNVMTADDLEGARIYGKEDEDIGEIATLIVDDSGKITHILADIGGFLGMGEHTVKLSFEELQLIKNEDASDLRIYVDSTEEKLEELPEHAEH